MRVLPPTIGALALSVVLGLSGCAQRRIPSFRVHSPRLVLISIDGLRPAFYRDPVYRAAAPTLARLSDQGERAPNGIHPIFPSITYPDHVSMVTGAYSAEHGVYNNRIFSMKSGSTDEWYWYARSIRVPTIWQVAKAHGLKVALLRWPASTGAKVDWEFPEIFAAGGFNAGKDWAVIRKYTDPGFLRHVLALGPIRMPRTIAELDEIDTQAAEYVLTTQNADLVLIHLINLDWTQHQFGTRSPAVTKAAARLDALLARIVRHLDPTKTTLIVTGDHGFASYTRLLHVGTLIRKAGLAGKVRDQVDGGEAAIYPGEYAHRVPHACETLAAAASKLGAKLTAISKKRLKTLHAYPKALCAIEAHIGWSFDEKSPAEAVETLPHPRGDHGYLPSNPQMTAGFFLWGKGLTHPGHPLRSDPRMPDIAPTAAAILKLPFQAPSGRRIRF